MLKVRQARLAEEFCAPCLSHLFLERRVFMPGMHPICAMSSKSCSLQRKPGRPSVVVQLRGFNKALGRASANFLEALYEIGNVFKSASVSSLIDGLAAEQHDAGVVHAHALEILDIVDVRMPLEPLAEVMLTDTNLN